nr:hypothetical protein [Paenibacillus xylanexedens]
MTTAVNEFKVSNLVVENVANDNDTANLESVSVDEVKNQIADFCKHNLAVGNERDARVDELSLNGTTATLKVWIRSKHKPNRWLTLYSVTYEIHGTYNLADPTSIGESEICVDTPVSKLCVKAKEIVTILLGLL